MIYCTSHFQGGSLCFSFFCLLVSSVSDFRPDTRGGGGHFLRLTCSVMLWGKRNTASKQHWFVLAVSRPHCVCPCSQRMCFLCLHCLVSRFLCRELSDACPGLYALPRSKLLMFRYSGTPQRRRLCWACVLCPSQVRAAQVMGCLASVVAATYRLSHSCCLVLWGYSWRPFSGGW